jgi:hypothetical protein
MNPIVRAISMLPLLFAVPQAWAHANHGEIHWHFTDVAGLVVIGVGSVLAVWLASDK